MKSSRSIPKVIPEFSDEDIAAYAEHLYEQSGRIPGRDIDNWLEAKACLQANIPRHESHRRLQTLLNGSKVRPDVLAKIRSGRSATPPA